MAMTKNGELLFSGPEPEESQAMRPLRVVVVEDDRDAVLSLMLLLREEGHEVHAIHSGRQAMGGVLDFDPDVVILDIHLPGQSGWEVARTIRHRRGRKRPMLIGVSGVHKQKSDRILSNIIGFDHYLTKPYAPADLLKLIGSAQQPKA